MSDIRRESVGEHYPYTVVGSVNEDGTLYYIANLERNERTSVWYESSYVAHYFLDRIAKGLEKPAWVQWVRR
jgi:hypothetical protein